MTLTELITAIELKHKETGVTIHPPATPADLEQAEAKIRSWLPADFKEFYSICNGFRCVKDNFSIVELRSIFADSDFGKDCIIFAEHSVFADVWVFRKLDDDNYEIFFSDDEETTLTTSLEEFLRRLLQGHLSEPGGLYGWPEEIKQRQKS